jgi:hypothetical protein
MSAAPKTRAYVRCHACGNRMSVDIALRDFDSGECICESCGAAVWVALQDLEDAAGQRLVSERPFEEPQDEAI